MTNKLFELTRLLKTSETLVEDYFKAIRELVLDYTAQRLLKDVSLNIFIPDKISMKFNFFRQFLR